MAFKLGRINFNAVAQGVGGLVFGSGDEASQEDHGVEQLLERISNGVLAEDRRKAMSELQDVVAESRSAQLAFGAMGLPVILAVLREERHDLDLVRGALETLVNALATSEKLHGNKSQVQPGVMNSELLSREPGSASLLLSLLEEEEFYVRYYTLQLLTTLCTNCPVRLQEAVLTTPQGITRLMDMLQDREVIRNEALLLLAFLTRSAEEIQKIAVFEGAFEKILSIILEEGSSEGGIVVQDCLELLNNILRNNPSNQIFLRETLGLQPIASLLKLRKSNSLSITQQKTVNLLCILETVTLLLSGDPTKEPGTDANVIANQTVLAQNNLLDYLLALSVEGRVSAVPVRCAALRCVGDLIHGHTRNCDLLASKFVGGESDAEPALHCILRWLLTTSHSSEWMSAEYVIKCFCEGNPDGQFVLASTITPVPESSSSGNNELEDDKLVSFGSILLRALHLSDGQKDLEASCRAASVLTHILKDNVRCKERVLDIPLEIPTSTLATTDLLMARCMRYLVAATYSHSQNSGHTRLESKMWLQPILLRLLVTWLADCPAAVASFLEIPAHLTVLIELLTSAGSQENECVSGLAAVLLGECIVFNTGIDSTKSGSIIVDLISQRVGLTAYFTKWDGIQGSTIFSSAASTSKLPKPLTRSTAAAVSSSTSDPIDEIAESSDLDTVEPVVTGFYDAEFVTLIRKLEPIVRDRIVELFSHPKGKASFFPSEVNKKTGETEADYISRLQALLHKQDQEMQEIITRNAALTAELLRERGSEALPVESGLESTEAIVTSLSTDMKGSFALQSELEALRQQIQEYQHKTKSMEKKQIQTEAEVLSYKQLAAKHEGDLRSLSDAYNSLEQDNYRLGLELRNLQRVVAVEGEQDAPKESEAELNDLLVCLGQEESKVEKLRARLEELGEDVDALLEGVGEGVEGDDEG